MSIIKHVISEEKERLLNLIKSYEKKIKNYPKGSVSKKKINDKEYAYFMLRENGQVKTRYIGLYKSDKVNEIKSQIQERKKLEGLLRQAKANLNEVDRFIE